ncbi:MAG: GNAT family N-acetyltransferase [Bacteroidota bacterium]|nr:GNAT family N-acetyltransferase [Bacteroidota bacterium]
MIFCQAQSADIPELQIVRNSVTENTLSDPALVPDLDVEDYINRRGRGWVALHDTGIVVFSIVSVMDNNVWALFIEPGFEKQGIGQKLREMMMNWYFAQTDTTIWLGTAPGTRAKQFYRKAGWQETGTHGKDEIKFEMTSENWKNQH